MIGKPKFNYKDRVIFNIDGMDLEGKVYIIDAYGTFFDDSDVSYDIMVENDPRHNGGKCLYKHIKEKFVRKA